MTPYAQQILEALHRRFSSMVFEWDNRPWAMGDSSPHALSIAFRTNPNNKFEINFETGIENDTPESIAKAIEDHAIPILKKR